MDLDAYCRRIDYTGPRLPTEEVLRALHRAHTGHVPFENLDIHRGVPIVLDEAAFFDKIVRRHRGGFCYELNGLFAAFLRELGFELDLLSARVSLTGSPGPEFDHLVLRVKLADAQLVDVGFGESFREPLLMVPDLEQAQGDRAYVLRRRGEDWILSKRGPDTPWTEQYRFTLTVRELAEFEGMCRHHQTSPESTFTKGRMITLPTDGGRITLLEDRFINVTEFGRVEWPVEGEGQFRRLLCERFEVDFRLEGPGEHYLEDVRERFGEQKRLAEAAMEQVDDGQFFEEPDEYSSLAFVVKHLAGNMRSRWTDFLISDGEKPDRHRDREFELETGDDRDTLMERWESGWRALFATLDSLEPADLMRTVRIRHEPHSVIQAIDRQITHYAYHVGQIVMISRGHAGAEWQTLSVPRGGTEAFNRDMAKKHGAES